MKIYKNPRVDFYFNKAVKWQQEVEKLRQIILESELTEVLKWGVPCYSLEDKNIVLIHDFKEYCALLFFKGALLKDPNGILIQQTKNVQAARQIRFTNIKEVTALKSVIKKYINEAIEVEKAGLKVPLKKTEAYKIPEEFQKILATDASIKKAFFALTPGRQRAYILFFSAPKLSTTKASRIEKCMPQILDGKGLND